jgi:argininosuccinate synthase
MKESGYKKIASHEARDGEFNKVLLLYSGGLDTSVMVKYIQEFYNADVYCLCVGIGQSDNIEHIKKKALDLGAKDFEYVDVRKRFAKDICMMAVKANADYEDGYRLFCPLGRVEISRTAVEYADKWDCQVIAHGATGKGNDQIRFENYITTLRPDLKVLAPVREWGMGRDEELEYAEKHNIPVEQSKAKIYSYDENLWGCSAEGGEIEDLRMVPPLNKILKHVTVPESAHERSQLISIIFEEGLPISVTFPSEDGNFNITTRVSNDDYTGVIESLNRIGSLHGIGITHLIEDRVVGLKVRGVYEEPGAEILVQAHKALEKIVCTREEYNHKKKIDQDWANMVYEGRWYHPLMNHINSYINSVNKKVTGMVTMKLYKGVAECVAIDSPYSLFNDDMSTFMRNDTFNTNASAGFIEHFNYSQKAGYNLTKNLYNE